MKKKNVKNNQDRLRDIFENTVEHGLFYKGSVDKIDYYSLFCKAASNDKLYKFMGNNLCMFNCKYEEQDSVMLIFYIAINNEDTGAKNVVERVMDVIEESEKCFITLSYVNTQEVKEEKFIYITIVKVI